MNVYVKIRVLRRLTVEYLGSSQRTAPTVCVILQTSRHIDQIAQLHPLSHRVGAGFTDRPPHTHSRDVVEIVVAVYRQLIARRKKGIQIARIALQRRAKVYREVLDALGGSHAAADRRVVEVRVVRDSFSFSNQIGNPHPLAPFIGAGSVDVALEYHHVLLLK